MKHLLTAIACFFALSMSAQTWNPDADFDNVIGVNDLMELLSVFGTEWTEEYPQDPEYEMAAYYVGELDLFDCIDTCRVNNGKVISIQEYSAFRDSITVAIGHTASALCGLPLNGNNSYYNETFFRTNSTLGYGYFRQGAYGYCNETNVLNNITVYTDNFTSGELHCVCAGLIPAVE